MTTFLRAFFTDFKSRFFSPSFWIMTTIVAFSYLASDIDELQYAWNAKGSDVLETPPNFV